MPPLKIYGKKNAHSVMKTDVEYLTTHDSFARIEQILRETSYTDYALVDSKGTAQISSIRA
jgi:hypothetical protein